MFEGITKFLKKLKKSQNQETSSNVTAKERLHLVLMQDRANVSVDFLEMMKQEIIEVIKKYIDVDENEIDVRLTNKTNEDGTNGAPALYANIPIISIKDEKRIEINERKEEKKDIKKENTVLKENKQNDEKAEQSKENKVQDKKSTPKGKKENEGEEKNKTIEDVNNEAKEKAENSNKKNSKTENV